jgi:signal peptidase II
MKQKWLIPAGIILLIIAADQLTKQLVAQLMEEGDSIVIIKNFFAITSHRNTGAAWGIFDGNMTFFYIITVIAGILFYVLLNDADMKHKKLYTTGIILMIAGGIGNFIDRLLFQEVIDFMNVDLWSYTTFPIFNIADIALVVGMIAFAADIILEDVMKWIRSKSEQTPNQHE